MKENDMTMIRPGVWKKTLSNGIEYTEYDTRQIIKDRRKRMKMTMQQLADLAGIDRSTVSRIKKTYNINFTLYSLRHLFAADLFRQGTNPKVIQTLLGHASENMSLYYAFTTDEERANAIRNRK